MYQFTSDSIALLKQLISTPSISRDEAQAADLMERQARAWQLPVRRIGNNILICDEPQPDRPTLLLNAHIDTVKPVSTWTRDPFQPTIEGDRLYGLGSNDCGGGLVSLLAAYRALRAERAQPLRGGTAQHPIGADGALPLRGRTAQHPIGADGALPLRGETAQHPIGAEDGALPLRGGTAQHPIGAEDGAQPLRGETAQHPMGAEDGALPSIGRSVLRGFPTQYNLVFLASCEEEVSGANGFSLALPQLPHIDVAIVGEPTGMQPAIAEKGLMVIDGVAHGKSGHAARDEGVNAIYEALDDLVWLRDYRFRRVSPLLGPTKMTVTVLNSGTQHNVVPDECRFVIDVRTNEYYQNEPVLRFLQRKMRKCELTARSFRLSSSHIEESHPLVQRCLEMGMTPFGSPTLSDQALMPFPSLKLGPGQSSRSHSADEFICLSEIEQAVNTYVSLLKLL